VEIVGQWQRAGTTVQIQDFQSDLGMFCLRDIHIHFSFLQDPSSVWMSM
jgi:hypothetical protein